MYSCKDYNKNLTTKALDLISTDEYRRLNLIDYRKKLSLLNYSIIEDLTDKFNEHQPVSGCSYLNSFIQTFMYPNNLDPMVHPEIYYLGGYKVGIPYWKFLKADNTEYVFENLDSDYNELLELVELDKSYKHGLRRL